MINIRRPSRRGRGPGLLWLALLGLLLFLLRAFILYWDTPPQPQGLRAPRESPAQAPGREDISISLYDADTGSVKEMALEEYLVGVVAAEMPASFHPEALKAQAVAARTYAWRRLEDPCGRGGAALCTDSACCQSYKKKEALQGLWGEGYGYYLDRIESAVEATAGEIILYGGEPIEALYHAVSGGMTEDAAHVFAGAAPYLVGVESAGEEGAANYRDEREFGGEAFARRANEAYPEAGLQAGELAGQVEIVSRYESGRVERLRLGGLSLTGREFRRLYGLNSVNFSLEFLPDGGVVIHTLGHGHGVGMSQYGANAMAQAGSGYVEILTHYYTGVSVESIGQGLLAEGD